MPTTGALVLRDRIFRVQRAEVTRKQGNWCVEIEAESQQFDGERWAPHLYHQGLRLGVRNVAALQGQATSWVSADDPGYPHPEIGALYVFGHHAVRNCALRFGKYKAGKIELEWSGECDIFCEGAFGKNVPFRCKCSAAATTA